MSPPTRPLGRNGPPVTAIGFGLMGLSAFYGETGSEEDRLAFLDHVYASGERFWDTADMYGDSEDLIGRWFRRNPGKRETIVLATKFAFVSHGVVRSDPAYVHEACAKSLARLGVDSIDLYYMHRTDRVTPIEDTIEAMVELKKQGKIKHIGVSEVSADTLRRAHAIHPIAALQIEYSPFCLDIESPDIGVFRACTDLGIAIVAYSPLGRGMLTGRFRSPADLPADDARRYAPRFSEENFSKNLVLVDQITALAKKKNCTPGQLSLAWLLAQSPLVIPIPGTKRIPYFDENMGAFDVTLTDAENKEIRAAIEAAEVAGDRSPLAGDHLLADTPKRK